MFYSHNLLARKGPLGTVWCAAHLQNKLRKSNYITINIPSTVEQIMNPQVPIALRMSGHLLLGVVRIYSKKVEYLQHDYNVLRIDINKAYVYADINLPEDANQARFESITLPDNFALDALDLDDYNPDGSPDTHLRRHEDITLADQSPFSLSKNKDQIPAGYIMISINDDVSSTPSRSNHDLGSAPMPMEEDDCPLNLPETSPGVQDPVSNHPTGSSDNFTNDDNEPLEKLRDHILNDDYLANPLAILNEKDNGSPLLDLPDRVEPDPVLEEQILNEKDNGSPTLDEILVPGAPLSPNKLTPLLNLTRSGPAQDKSDLHVSFGLASSPRVEPAEVAEQPRAKRRRLKYDEATVLTNEFMKKSVDDPSNLLRKRKGVCSSLGVWKLNNARKKEKVLFDPIITGLCDDLYEMFEDRYISTKTHLIAIEEAHPNDSEVEHPRDFVGPSEINMIPTYSPDNNLTHMPSPDNRSFTSPREMDEYTPSIGTNIGSKSYQVDTTFGTGVGPTPDQATFGTSMGPTPDQSTFGTGVGPTSSTKSFMSGMETPMSFSRDRHGFDMSGGLYDIPEVDDVGELNFLEDEEGTPMKARGTPEADYSSGKQRPPPEIDSLLSRTRAVAQYIKEKASVTPSTPKDAPVLSLNGILEGKKRKVCARMFFETLVLKSCDLVDVKQDEPYGDITLKVTSKLSKQRFSG